jgi:hypothetical protein
MLRFNLIMNILKLCFFNLILACPATKKPRICGAFESISEIYSGYLLQHLYEQ